MTVTGTSIKLYATTTNNQGFATLALLDSSNNTVATSTLDFYSKNHESNKLKYISPLLTSGTYTLRLTVTGTHGTWTDKAGPVFRSTDNYVTIDRAVDGPTATPGGPIATRTATPTADAPTATRTATSTTTYTTLVARHSGKVAMVSGSSTADSTNLVQWTSNGSFSQQWRINDLGTGYIQLIACHSNKCLDVTSASMSPTAPSSPRTPAAAAPTSSGSAGKRTRCPVDDRTATLEQPYDPYLWQTLLWM